MTSEESTDRFRCVTIVNPHTRTDRARNERPTGFSGPGSGYTNVAMHRDRRIGPITLNFSKDPAFVSAVRLTVAAIAVQAGIPFETLEDLKLVAAEAATYSIQRGVRTGSISMTVECDHHAFLILLHDPNFRPQGAPNNPWPADDVADELYLIRTLADELRYNVSEQDGLRLRISKSVEHARH
jgi:anti-sigma regulatory factor (Ser/Thr protein kinase)